MVDPLQYCGGENELNQFLETLWSYFSSHKHLYPIGHPHQVKYAGAFLNMWNNCPDMTQQQTEIMYSAKLASNLWEVKDPCLESLELFSSKFQNIYGDEDRLLNSATKAMQEYQ